MMNDNENSIWEEISPGMYELKKDSLKREKSPLIDELIKRLKEHSGIWKYLIDNKDNEI